MRPKKQRSVECLPEERCFQPRCRKAGGLEGVSMGIDEFEALRLADLQGLTHARAAKLMKVSRPTFTRILSSAHGKVADGLVNIKAIHIEGGCCTIKTGRKE